MEVISLGGSSHSFVEQSGQSSQSKSSSRKSKLKYVQDEEDDEEDDGYEKISITKTKTIIRKKKKVRKGGGHYELENGDEEYEESDSEAGTYSMYENSAVAVRHRVPKPAVCMTWNGNKVKTFDGLTYTSNLYCSHILVQDAVAGTFSVVLRLCPYGTDSLNGSCETQALIVFLQSVRYTFTVSGKLRHY